MDTFTQSDIRAEGYAAMTTRLMGCTAPAHTPCEPAERIAFLEGMLAALDRARSSLVESIAQCERAIERNAAAREA